ncbi:hypothetical protein LTR16_009411, partial [Cryomyces antarcticus]
MASDRDILPDDVKPTNYAISLFDLELGGEFSYQGTVDITLDIKKETKEITLNANDLKIDRAELSTEVGKTQQSMRSTQTLYDHQKQRITLTFDDPLPPSSEAVLSIRFSGTMNNI